MDAVRTPMIFIKQIQISVTRQIGVPHVLRDLCVYTASPRRLRHDLTASLAFLLSLHGVPTASARRPPATRRRSWRFYHDLTASMALARRLHGDCTPTPRRYSTSKFFISSAMMMRNTTYSLDVERYTDEDKAETPGVIADRPRKPWSR